MAVCRTRGGWGMLISPGQFLCPYIAVWRLMTLPQPPQVCFVVRSVFFFLVLSEASFLALALGLGTATFSSTGSSGTAGSSVGSSIASSSSTINTALGICLTDKNVCAGTKFSLEVEACAANPVA